MPTLFIVDNPTKWPLKIPGVDVVSAHEYLTDADYNSLRGVKAFNLCRSYRYQTEGYYVSLLAEARGHNIIPNITTIQDLKSQTLIRIVSDDLNAQMQRSLSRIQSDQFILSIYFGKNMAKRYDRLCLQLFNQFRAPLLRAEFVRNDGEWTLQRINPVSANAIPESHHDFVVEAATQYFKKRSRVVPKRHDGKYDLAILVSEDDAEPPSDERAIRRFVRAANREGMNVDIINREDYGRIAEFDALFIRATTAVNHYTYRFARRAAAEGMVVIDDPESIIRCTNKVYMAEILSRHHIRIPKTVIVHRDNADTVGEQIGYPCILKRPDSSFSMGVEKAENEIDLRAVLDRLFNRNEMLVAQEFMPTDFDWRVGVLDQKPLYVCKYYMADKHWQIMNWQKRRGRYGKTETLPVKSAPRTVVTTALKAANLMGDGLYGVDLKQVGTKCYVIEVNDNPSIEADCEDLVLKDDLYRKIMHSFYRRLERRAARP